MCLEVWAVWDINMYAWPSKTLVVPSKDKIFAPNKDNPQRGVVERGMLSLSSQFRALSFFTFLDYYNFYEN